MSNELFQYISIHDHQDRIDDLIELLNTQWNRSESSRRVMIEKSSEDLPYYLLMLDKSNDNKLIASCSMSKVIDCADDITTITNQKSESILIENVLVKKEYRRKGYGKLILNELERIAISKGYKTFYLSTLDQKEFYLSNGYQLCEPLAASKFTSSFINEEGLDKRSSLMRIFGGAGNQKKDSETVYWLSKNV
ncbi:hypothetical protein PPL_11502 [Heterostelium album PN500]|uniref:N-acetyltransferase domain-containing protein n=1 Tax=Heterostelium pallidum (strain ATCC 26659 / Pp 5 / PN500) TaxID=670386 RepID=D3BTK5_HETP5|nr:hypothetical protein PPL_11502 [Heterostelium album PN500]EFA75422.1 hypothetical protein PPL_11502 [Heterostelium album PN500]|eukprot:XP_020427556.1 hypothetical protein PPL_11502 [Heterostelium album PN500]